MGNSLTSLIVTCAPDSQCLDETISSLKFAQRACKVQTQAQNAETVSKYNTLKRLSLQQLQADYK